MQEQRSNLPPVEGASCLRYVLLLVFTITSIVVIVDWVLKIACGLLTVSTHFAITFCAFTSDFSLASSFVTAAVIVATSEDTVRTAQFGPSVAAHRVQVNGRHRSLRSVHPLCLGGRPRLCSATVRCRWEDGL